ncbi:uncharacterized protein [Danio rerio]|uniref:Uncharacterized protein n=1 Tax=Danio rerio TaxID=7955 RepID=A0AC58HE75_DANRE
MVFTVLARVLLGVILLCFIQNVINEEVDIETLSRLKQYFHMYVYDKGQYAVAINVPKEQCQSGFEPSKDNFLTKENWDDVTIQRNSKKVYEGTELIAAGVHKEAHSEYLLMNPENNSPLTRLLNNKNRCVVFYTLNSPCVGKCLYNKVVLAGLKELQKYQGMKAFVYTNIYTEDQTDPELRAELKTIADLVPLYRCKGNSCISCGQDVIDACLNS